MKVKYFLPIILLSLFILGCPKTPSLVAEYTFQTDSENWVGEFSDLPVNHEDYELDFDYKPLPSYLAENKNAIFTSGWNKSDNLFMFIKHQLINENLKANTTYQIKFHIEIATNAPSGCAGVGGPPGESVYLKAGASIIEPLPIEQDGYYKNEC